MKKILLLLTLSAWIGVTGTVQQINTGITINGITWSIKNSGASKPEDYGSYYTWSEALRACPQGWRLPSKYELELLLNEWNGYDQINGIYGVFFGGDSNKIFLPFAGYKYNNMLCDDDYSGYYWSSDEFERYNEAAYCIEFYGADGVTSCRTKENRFSVRCVKI